MEHRPGVRGGGGGVQVRHLAEAVALLPADSPFDRVRPTVPAVHVCMHACPIFIGM